MHPESLFPPRIAAYREAWAAVGSPSSGRRRTLVGWVFPFVLATYTAIAVAKVHELLPEVGSLQPGKIVGVLLVVTAYSALPWHQILAVLRSSTAKWIGLIAALAVLSVPLAVWPGYALQFLTGDFWKTFLFFVVAAAGLSDRRTLRLCILALVVSTSAIAVAALLGVSPAVAGRFYVGAALDPNESGLLFLVAIPFALHLAGPKGWGSWLWYGTAFVLVGGIVKTGSRGAFLGLTILGMWLVYQARAKRAPYILALIGGVAVFELAANDATWQRLASIVRPTADYNYTDREGRIEVWKRGLGYLATHPVLGVGLHNFSIAEGMLSGKENEGYGIKYSAAHNSFIEIGAELGILGLTAFIGVLWTAAAGCWRIRRRGRHQRDGPVMPESEMRIAGTGVSALVALVVASSFLSFAYHPVTWFVVAVCVAVQLGSPGALHRHSVRRVSAQFPRGRRVG